MQPTKCGGLLIIRAGNWIKNTILDSTAYVVGRFVQWESIKTKLELFNCPMMPEGWQDSTVQPVDNATFSKI